MLNATDPEGIVRFLARRSDAAGTAARKAMLGFVRKSGAPAIATLAKQKAPRLFGDLKGSGQEYDTPQGARITFGGLAAAYAAKVHEDTRVSHSGARSGKHVYRGSGLTVSKRGGGASNPGEWNKLTRPVGKGYKGRITGWANAVTRHRSFYGGARGSALIEWSGNNWRFRKASYAKRYPASRYPKTGQAHFLHGAPNSAYEEKRPWMLMRMAEVGMRAAGEAVRRGTA